MKKLYKIQFVSILFLIIFFQFTCQSFAEVQLTQEEQDAIDLQDFANEVTESFYIEKSSFSSSFEYEKYCQKMYNYGYMDDNYNWTSEARQCINDMTKENMDKLSTAAKSLVNERIETGKMKKSDNPYLTYEEKQQALKEEAETSATEAVSPVQSPTDGSDEIINEDINDEGSSLNINDDNEQSAVAEEKKEDDVVQSSTSHIITIIFIILVGLIIILGGYYIYKRQF